MSGTRITEKQVRLYMSNRKHHPRNRCQVPKHTGVDPHLGAGSPAAAWVSELHINAMIIVVPASASPSAPRVSETCYREQAALNRPGANRLGRPDRRQRSSFGLRLRRSTISNSRVREYRDGTPSLVTRCVYATGIRRRQSAMAFTCFLASPDAIRAASVNTENS